MASKSAKPEKKKDLAYRDGVTARGEGISVEGKTARIRFKCLMGGESEIAEVSRRLRPETRIDFQSVDGAFNLSMKNGVISVSNAKDGDLVEVDQAWAIGRPSGYVAEGMTWILVDGTLVIDGKGRMPDYDDSRDAPWYIYRAGVRRVEIRGRVSSVGKKAFNKFKSLTSANLGNATIVGSRAFADCPSLRDVSMDSVHAVNNGAFSGCISIERLRLGYRLDKINRDAFSKCLGLSEIVFNCAQMPEIDPGAFYKCSGVVVKSPFDASSLGEKFESEPKAVAQIYVDESGGDGQRSCEYVSRDSLRVKAADFEGNVFELSDSYSVEPQYVGSESPTPVEVSYCGVSSLVSLEHSPRTSGTDGVEWSLDPEDGTLVVNGSGRMRDFDAIDLPPWHLLMDRIEAVLVSDDITSIGKRAFDGCERIKTIQAPNVVEIGDYAFRGCRSLKRVQLTHVERIGAFAFQSCTELASASLGSNVSKIGKKSFEGCPRLSILKVGASKAPAMDDTSLLGTADVLTVYSKIDDDWVGSSCDKTVVYKRL